MCRFSGGDAGGGRVSARDVTPVSKRDARLPQRTAVSHAAERLESGPAEHSQSSEHSA